MPLSLGCNASNCRLMHMRDNTCMHMQGGRACEGASRVSVVCCSLGERVSHYASLIVAESPIQAHRDYVQEQRRRTSIISAAA